MTPARVGHITLAVLDRVSCRGILQRRGEYRQAHTSELRGCKTRVIMQSGVNVWRKRKVGRRHQATECLIGLRTAAVRYILVFFSPYRIWYKTV